jgi:subtilase family serine protease
MSMGDIVRLGLALSALLGAWRVYAKPVTAVLRIKEKIAIEEFARDVNNPRSPRYHKFYTPEELRAFAAPSQGEYDRLIQTLQESGFKVVAESPTHLWLTVQAESNLFERTFATKLASQGKGLRKPAVAPQIPNHLNLIASVVGLDNTRKAVPKLVMPS